MLCSASRHPPLRHQSPSAGSVGGAALLLRRTGMYWGGLWWIAMLFLVVASFTLPTKGLFGDGGGSDPS